MPRAVRGAKLALNNAVSTDATATRIAIDDIAADTKAAASVAGSLVSSLVYQSAALTASDVDNFVSTGRTANGALVTAAATIVNQAKSLAKSVVALSQATKTAAAATFAQNVLLATPAAAVKAAASAEAIEQRFNWQLLQCYDAVKTAMSGAVNAALLLTLRLRQRV